MDSTSESLLLRLRRPNEDMAWQRFVDLYGPLIFYWGKKHGLDSNDAADLVQDVLSVVVKKISSFDYDPNLRFRGWLRTVTANKVRDYFRRLSVHSKKRSNKSVDEIVDNQEIDLFEHAEYTNFVVKRALDLMKSEFRDEVWQACWKQVVEGVKASDVAQEMDLPLNVVYLAKSRVLKRLREELDGLMD